MGEYPVLVRCHLCGDRLACSPARTWYVAIDHAADEHRAALDADPAGVPDFFTVSAGATPTPLRRTCRTGGVR